LMEENHRVSVGDPVKMFLQEASKYPMLTIQEERELGRKSQYEDCQESRDKLITSNMRLVIAAAKKYQRRGLPLEDLIQDGLTGLIKAVGKYRVDIPTKLSTMAMWWI